MAWALAVNATTASRSNGTMHSNEIDNMYNIDIDINNTTMIL